MKPAPISEGNKKKVYLITNNISGNILLENELRNMDFISQVRKGSPNVINQMNESFLSLFDCFIYDFSDYGFCVNHEKPNEIEQYIKNDGGSFLVTHNHWDYRANSNIKTPLNLLGFEYYEKFPYLVSNKARFVLLMLYLIVIMT